MFLCLVFGQAGLIRDDPGYNNKISGGQLLVSHTS